MPSLHMNLGLSKAADRIVHDPCSASSNFTVSILKYILEYVIISPRVPKFELIIVDSYYQHRNFLKFSY